MANSDLLAEAYGGPTDFTPSLYHHLEAGMKANPHGQAIVAMHQPANQLAELFGIDQADNSIKAEYFACTHSQLHRAALRLALGLQARGVQPDSTLLTLIPNTAEWALLFLTSTILRLTLVAIDPGALGETRAPELEDLLNTLKPAVIVVSKDEDTAAVDRALKRCEDLTPLRISRESLSNDTIKKEWTTLVSLVTHAVHDRDAEADLIVKAEHSEPDRNCLIVFTSGTSSGAPKGCPRSVANMTYWLETNTPNRPIDGPRRFLLVGANFRVIAPALTLATWTYGGTIVMPDAGFDPKSALHVIESQKITHVLLIPSQLHALLADETLDSTKLGSVRVASFGADIVTLDHLQKAERAFPLAKIMPSHGSSEGGGFFLWPFFDRPVSSIPGIGGIVPLGMVTPGTRLRVFDADQGCVAHRGEPGELHACSPSLLKHYLGGVHEEAFYEDGVGRWYKTGDQALMTKDGLVYILGRYSQMLKRGGIAIQPAALETCIQEYTGRPVR